MNATRVQQIAAFLGFMGVLLGAFGAHALNEILTKSDRVDTWETAVFYHFVHAIGLLVVSRMTTPPKWTVYLFVAGIIIFSGSLYALCLTGVTKLGAITPIGGLALMAGWLTLCWPQKNHEKRLHGQ
jgi:uncharacterized membrane protein YgdD (TMEM256/DUF423 family)